MYNDKVEDEYIHMVAKCVRKSVHKIGPIQDTSRITNENIQMNESEPIQVTSRVTNENIEMKAGRNETTNNDVFVTTPYFELEVGQKDDIYIRPVDDDEDALYNKTDYSIV